LIDNLSYLKGKSNYKFGIDVNFDRILNFFPGLFSGSYTFPSYTSFGNNAPTAFTQNFAGAGTTGGTTHPDSSDYAFFAQDDLRLTPKLTLNLGVRYDYQKLACPKVQNTDRFCYRTGLIRAVAQAIRTTLLPGSGLVMP